MKEYKSLTELIPEMEPDEIFYKRIFLEYPEAHLDQAHTVEEIEKLCPEASSHAAAGFTYHPGNALQSPAFRGWRSSGCGYHGSSCAGSLFLPYLPALLLPQSP